MGVRVGLNVTGSSVRPLSQNSHVRRHWVCIWKEKSVLVQYPFAAQNAHGFNEQVLTVWLSAASEHTSGNVGPLVGGLGVGALVVGITGQSTVMV